MAAIIAQLTQKNWERILKQRYYVSLTKKLNFILLFRNTKNYSSSKSTYSLPPYDETFNPWIHNKYLAKKRKASIAEIEQRIDEQIHEMIKAHRKKIIWKKFTLRRCLCESVIMIFSLSLVPILFLLIQVYWPEDDNVEI